MFWKKIKSAKIHITSEIRGIWLRRELKLMKLLLQHCLLIQQHSDPPSLLIHKWNPGNIEERFESFWTDMRLDIHSSDASFK